MCTLVLGLYIHGSFPCNCVAIFTVERAVRECVTVVRVRESESGVEFEFQCGCSSSG